MSGAQHTPGPWRIYDDAYEFVIVGRPNWPCRRNGVAGEWDVATVWDLGSDQDGAGPEALANAHLIAAAPDMLAALRLVLDADQMAIDQVGLGEFVEADETAMQAVRAAIAKAEGRS